MIRPLLMFMFFLMPTVAFAGFEWIPPADKPQVSQTPSPQSMQRIAQPPLQEPRVPDRKNDNLNGAFAPAPVMVQPLKQPVNINPAPMMAVQQPSVKPKTGLVINPYPLQNDTSPAVKKNSMTEQALAQYAGALTPIQLGAGMTTGAQPPKYQKVSRANRTQQKTSVMRTPVVNRSTGTSLTPIPGGEPQPLLGMGIEDAYRNTSVTAQDMPKTYANAVGFGRDLPLELAVSQVIPADYSHRIMGVVKADAMVSWEGGKPWNIILNDMLRTQNMTAIIQGKQVIIQPMARL